MTRTRRGTRRNSLLPDTSRDTFREELELFPDLSFWYGLGFVELVNMPNWALRMYARALSRLKAEYEITNNRAASFAHMKKSSQRQIMAELNRRVREGNEPSKLDSQKSATNTLGGIGFGFVDERDKEKA